MRVPLWLSQLGAGYQSTAWGSAFKVIVKTVLQPGRQDQPSDLPEYHGLKTFQILQSPNPKVLVDFRSLLYA